VTVNKHQDMFIINTIVFIINTMPALFAEDHFVSGQRLYNIKFVPYINVITTFF